MAFYVGEKIRQGFYTGVAGETFTLNISRSPGGSTFLGAIVPTDLGNGDYLFEFTPSAPGNYYARFTGDVSGEVIKGNWDVDSPPAFAAASTAALGVSTMSIEWVEVIPS